MSAPRTEPRTWTLSGARWDDPIVIDGPRIDRCVVEVIEKEPVLDLVERLLRDLVDAREVHPDDMTPDERSAVRLLRAHGRFGGEDD